MTEIREDLQEILDKTAKQASVSTQGPMRAVLIECLTVFDDTYSASAAYTRALHDWSRNRKTDSKRGALREIKADTGEIRIDVGSLLSEVVELRAEVALLKRLLYSQIEQAKATGCDSVEDGAE